MRVFIKPNDTLFFRDGKPFTSGEQTEGSGIFPPYPSTVYGALRTAYISRNGGLQKFLRGEMKAEIGTPTENGSFRIKSCLIGTEDNTFFPVPRDMAKPGGNESYHKLKLMSESPFMSNRNKLQPLWTNDAGKIEYIESDYIAGDDLTVYLNGKKSDFKPIHSSEYMEYEPKVGIGRNKTTRTSEEGKLYRISMYRLKDGYGIVVDFEGAELGESGMVRLGGEGKSAGYWKVVEKENYNADFIAPIIDKNRNFKIYFASPAIFSNGWIPSGMNKDSLEWNYNGLRLKLIAAS